MNRAEHLAWCKERALAVAARGDLGGAVTSMLSDLAKHDDTKASAGYAFMVLGMAALQSRNADEVRRYIEGFN